MSYQKEGTATVTYKNVLIPIASDGDNAPENIEACTIEEALKYNWKPYHLGFKFGETISVKVTLEDEDKPLTFSKKVDRPKTYYFTKEIVSHKVFKEDVRFKDKFNRESQVYMSNYLDDKNILFVGNRGLTPLLPDEQKNTVLIDQKTGSQLWPKR